MTQREELEKMQEILRDKIEVTIPDYSTNGKCSRCGRCCSNLLSMTIEDVHRIRDYLRMHNVVPAPPARPAQIHPPKGGGSAAYGHRWSSPARPIADRL